MTVLCAHPIYAQEVKVIDQGNLQPLQKVLIYAGQSSYSISTNVKGRADITQLKDNDSIVFSHVSYQLEVYSWRQIQALKFVVPLTEKSVALNEAVVSASKFAEKAEDVAQPVQVIKAKELAFMNQQSTADVLQNSGGVMVQKSQLGGGSPIIRGFETNKVLMVIDGVRMNNAIYRGGHLQNVITVDNTMLDKLEIVYGPGSVVYGSDALGGVMHFFTKNPLLADNDKLLVKANAFTRYSSAYAEGTGHVDFSLGKQRFASLTSITYSNFGDLMQGNQRNPFYGDWGKRNFYVKRFENRDSVLTNSNPNLQVGSGYQQFDLLQKFVFQPKKGVQHLLNLQYSASSDINRYDRLTQTRNGEPRFAEWYYGPQERLMAAYSLHLSNPTRLYDEAKTTLAYQQIVESRHNRNFQSDNLDHRTETLDIFTLNADFAKRIDEHEIRYGIDAWYNGVDSKGESENIITGDRKALDSRYPSAGSSMQSVALYLTHAWEISKKLILNDGIRFNVVGLEADFSDKRFFPFPFNQVQQNNEAINGNLGLVYLPCEGWRFTLFGATGFRAPNIDDLSKVFESVPGSVVVPNPDLKPEYTWNIDLGISKTFGKKLEIGANVFHTWYRNAITVQGGSFQGSDSIVYDGQKSGVISNTNAGRAYIYGFNAFLRADITPHFSIVNSVNYTYGRIETDSTPYPLDHIPPVFGKSSFQLKMKKFRAEFIVFYSGAKRASDYNLLGEDNVAFSADPVNGYMPAWVTLNLRTAYQVNRYLRVQVALDNILDQNYRVYASNISAPGRNLVLTLRGNF